MIQMPDWLGEIAESAQIRALVEALRDQGGAGKSVVADGSRGSSTSVLAGALAAMSGRPMLLVVAHLDEADDALDDLELFQGLDALRFGALEVLPGETSVHLELLAERLGVVERLGQGRLPEPSVIVAPVQALMQSAPAADRVSEFTLTVRHGMQLEPGRLLDWLDRAGYTRTDGIENPGEFAIRGGIIDLYPAAGAIEGKDGTRQSIGPIRLDFFGDELDELRRIDADLLGSGEHIEAASLVGGRPEQLQAGEGVNVLDLLPERAVTILHEPMELQEQARGYYERLTNPVGVYSPNTVFAKLTGRAHVEVNQYSRRLDTVGVAARVELPLEPLHSFDTDAKTAVKELAELASTGATEVRVLCRAEADRHRLEELLADEHPKHEVKLEVGGLHRGFVWGGKRTSLLIPHHELFHRYETRRRVRKVTAGQQASDAFLDLEVGDVVVHVDHGIARFVGLKTMRKQGASEEYLTLQFAQKSLLHVPAAQIDLIQKYVGGFEGRPPLSILGGKTWNRQKAQVAEAVKDMAAELLRVQAARETQPGIRYPGDTAWQREFEAEFPFDETTDQLAAIAAVKNDMNQDRPMDRLICGDVGFGKTEVAIRAAFKAAEFGKQVGVLVPTTVLAEQHERTFKQRFADYPFRVESLSRFKTAKEVRKVLDDLAKGAVDILIGTHRLLSKDVKFSDLGLIIIDEEQRFGVEHKNKLLEFRLTADVLTMTATPIPRTLHMSMIGLRDISSLSTAPVDRRAIVTEVAPYDNGRIKQAIHRELARGGQVYFVHNRVHNIETVADDIQKLAPDARIIIGHGQMSPRKLEQVMLSFIRGQADVLVSTTIIESGIDIASANTMLINQADHFGLSELHQLRGRVGRSKHRAYCYLLLPEDRTISEVAAKRLKALENYSMLGAGFKIAMRDLELRGAGNLLGSEQSGHIAAVGYEMYCLLLEQATRRLKNEKVIEPTRTHLELGVTGSLPKGYIKSDKRRMDGYRRLTRVGLLPEFNEVVQDLTDAYGKPPEPAATFIDLQEIRIAASTHGIDAIKRDGPDLIFTPGSLPAAKLAELFTTAPGRTTVLDEKTLYWRPPANYLEQTSTLLAVLRKLLVRPLREEEQPPIERPGMAIPER